MNKTRFKKHLRDLKRLRMGPHLNFSSSLFLDRNERIVPYDEKTLRLLLERVTNAHLNLYPDLEIFYQKLARWLSVKEEQIYVTEGVSGAIKSLVETLTEAGDTIIFPTPTFALYPIYCQMFGLEYRTVGYTKDYRLDVEKMHGFINEKTAIVFLPNPNVPIEGTLNFEEIASFAKHCARYNTFLAIDEVYFSFGGPTAISLIDRFDNLFVMRSFSKAFGLAGIRLGYLVGNEKNIEYVSKTRTGYETNTVSAEIASFFIDNYHLVEAYIRDVKEGLAYLKEEFDKLGLAYNGGNSSNFLYVDAGDKALVEKIVGVLKTKDIYIRGGWPEPYSNGFCVTGGPKSVMEKFVNELSLILRNRMA